MDGAYIIKPVYKTLELLKAVGEAGRPVSLGEVCAMTGLPKSTAFKYLRTLRECGFLSHDPQTDTYQVGIAVWQLGRLSGTTKAVREMAAPLMRKLGERFDETVNLGVLEDTDVVYVEIVESSHALQTKARLGGADPAYTTALGKAILAVLPADEWRSHVPPRLTARTPRTISTVAALERELDAIRRHGYAVDREETDVGVVSVAAPVLGGDATVVGAIGLSAPTTRLSKKREREVAVEVVATAGTCSELLGHTVVA